MPKKASTEKHIEYGSDEHIAGLENAYKIRRSIAEKVVKEFESGEKDWDVNYYERCKRLISIIDSPKPKAVSPREGWKRDRSY